MVGEIDSLFKTAVTWPRQRRGGWQPGATPRVSGHVGLIRPEGAEGFPAPFQGAQESFEPETQGVALG
jgi:hypothetical protein